MNRKILECSDGTTYVVTDKGQFLKTMDKFGKVIVNSTKHQQIIRMHSK